MKKTFICLILLTVSSLSFSSEIKSGPLDMLTLNLEPQGRLTFSYVIGGGCADHEPLVSLNLIPSSSGKYLQEVEVIIQDVASGQDFCEARIYRDGAVELLPLIKETLKKSGSDLRIGNNFTFKLPKVNQTITR